MKMHRFFFLMALLLTLASCSGGKADFSTPEATFQTMVGAIKAKDFDVYSQCWHSERMAEGLVPMLKAQPVLWDELAKMVEGDLSLEADGDAEERQGSAKRFRVISPEVTEGKGLGTISLMKEGEQWKMYHW